jgi:hypothetical protein
VSRIAAVAALVAGIVAVGAMRATAPHYVRITGPIAYPGAPDKMVRTDNLIVTAGQPRLAKAIRFRENGKIQTRDSGGVWLVVPVASRVEHKTAQIDGAVWEAADGRRYRASRRVELGDAMLSSIKQIQPTFKERHDLAVFELNPDSVAGGGTLLLSEARDPQLTAQAQIRYLSTTRLAPPVPVLDLDELHDQL